MLVFTLPSEPVDGFLSTSHGYFVGIRKTSEYTFVALNLFQGHRSHKKVKFGLTMLECTISHEPYSYHTDVDTSLE